MSALRSAQFAITWSRQGATDTMELHGELDLAVAPQLVAEFDGRLASDPGAVIVDLRDLSFMDARGLRALVILQAKCETQGRRFALVRGQRAVQRLFELSDLARTFEFVESANGALEADHSGVGRTTETVRLSSSA